MKKIPVNEVRDHLAKYLSAAESGEEIIITKYNKPVAKLVGYSEEERPALPDLTEFRKKIKVKGKPMSEFLTDMRQKERY